MHAYVYQNICSMIKVPYLYLSKTVNVIKWINCGVWCVHIRDIYSNSNERNRAMRNDVNKSYKYSIKQKKSDTKECTDHEYICM